MAASDQIWAFLARARRLDRLRKVLGTASKLVLLVAVVGSLATAVTALTLRGDVVGPATLGGLVIAAAVWGARTWIRHKRSDAGEPRLLIARRIAGTRGALARDPISRDDARLRRELLGATELLLELEARGSTGEGRGGSRALALAYARSVADRIEAARPGYAVPRWAWRPQLSSAIALAAVWLALLTTAQTATAFDDLLHMHDGRPPKPPESIWSRLELTLAYPAHTGRPARRVPNPSGALRVPAGTEVSVEFWTRRPEPAARLMVLPGSGTGSSPDADPRFALMQDIDDGAGNQAGGDDDQLRHFRGQFTTDGAARWVAQLVDDDDEVAAYSTAQLIELEADNPPEVELAPLSDGTKEASEVETVTLRFTARDDFGLSRAELVYQLPDGTVHRLPIGEPVGVKRRWSDRYAWDLGAIPVDERGALTYWIEVWDNDPELAREAVAVAAPAEAAQGVTGGLQPELGGKVGRSARQKLQIRDREAEYAANIESLRQLRDAAVDLLAARLLAGDVFDDPAVQATNQLAAAGVSDEDAAAARDPQAEKLAVQIQGQLQVQASRELHAAAGELLARIAQAVDALSVDTLAREREVRTLAAIHARLLETFREEEQLHASMSPGAERTAKASRVRRFLRDLGQHNVREQSSLEDEIIRLDDLVDGELLRQLEAMSARLEASQQKLVELLEALKAGDESVRPQIEQLQERIREDMQRFNQTRAKLSKEVGREFFNRDAFENLEKMMRSQDLLESLRNGEVDKALQQAREALDEMRGMNDAMQERLGEGGEQARLDPEEEARMQLLRELSRLQDQQRGLKQRAATLDKAWREAVADRAARDRSEQTRTSAQDMLEQLESINDARLSRAGREAFEDAREALQRLVETTQPATDEGPSPALPRWEAASKAREALESAQRGTPEGEAERKALEKLSQRAAELEEKLASPLPSPKSALDGATREQAEQSSQSQASLRAQGEQLDASKNSDPLPEHGREALREANQAMREAATHFERADGRAAQRASQRAFDGLQRAIDSLRQSSPPPPAGGGGDSSTEAERDKSLREAVVEAMREGKGDATGADDAAVSRYYEELLE